MIVSPGQEWNENLWQPTDRLWIGAAAVCALRAKERGISLDEYPLFGVPFRMSLRALSSPKSEAPYTGASKA